MIRFTAIRLVEIAAMVVLMSFVIYALIGLMPGDPIDLMMGADPHLNSADLARLKTLYGVDRPLFERYLAWAQAALHGNFGYSRLFAAPVVQTLLPRLGNSLILLGSSFVIGFALSVSVSRRRGGRARVLTPRSISLVSRACRCRPSGWRLS
jgi:peptide/nickel transport system permease protein